MREVVKSVLGLGLPEYGFVWEGKDFVARKIDDGICIECDENYFEDLKDVKNKKYWLEPKKTLFSAIIHCMEYILKNKVNRAFCYCMDNDEVIEGNITNANKAVFKVVNMVEKQLVEVEIVKPSVTLLQITKDAEKLIEKAGRTCYKSEDKITDDSASKFVKFIVYRGHHSVIEHAVATIKTVTDRGITHEWVRHRICSFSQESTRYVRYNSIQVINPGFEENTEEYLLWLDFCSKSHGAYKKLLDLGYKPQIARSVLPNCLKTEIVTTTNFREWLHIIKLRSSEAAHPQIRPIAKAVSNLLHKYAPTVFPYFDEELDVDIFDEVQK